MLGEESIRRGVSRCLDVSGEKQGPEELAKGTRYKYSSGDGAPGHRPGFPQEGRGG